MQRRGRPSWPDAKRVLSVDDPDCPTCLLVLGLSHERIEHVLTVFEDLPALEVLRSEADDLPEPVPFDETWKQRICGSVASRDGQHTLRSGGRDLTLQIYIEASMSERRLDLDLTFWNDLVFPPSLAEPEWRRKFDALVELAESLRSGCSDARCEMYVEGYEEPLDPQTDAPPVVW